MYLFLVSSPLACIDMLLFLVWWSFFCRDSHFKFSLSFQSYSILFSVILLSVMDLKKFLANSAILSQFQKYVLCVTVSV